MGSGEGKASEDGATMFRFVSCLVLRHAMRLFQQEKPSNASVLLGYKDLHEYCEYYLHAYSADRATPSDTSAARHWRRPTSAMTLITGLKMYIARIQLMGNFCTATVEECDCCSRRDVSMAHNPQNLYAAATVEAMYS